MPDEPDVPAGVSDNLTEVVRRAILEAADMRELEDRAREIGERISKLEPTHLDETEGGPVT